MSDLRLWHGGMPGLRVGEVLLPGHARKTHEGCAVCEARANGQHAGIDPPSARAAVYITNSKEYARYYASLYGRGDLYTVEPVGPVELSREDHFPTWTCGAARVVGVYQRAILLTWTQRRALWRLWGEADKRAMSIPPSPEVEDG